MGTHQSKNRDLKSNYFANVQSKSYRFLDTSEITSSSTPKLIKCLIVKPQSRPIATSHGLTTSDNTYGILEGWGDMKPFAFLKDEKYLVCDGSPEAESTSVIRLDMGNPNKLEIRQKVKQESCVYQDNFCQVGVFLPGEMETLINYAVCDIAISASADYVAFLTFHRHNHLQLWKCTDEYNLDFVELIEFGGIDFMHDAKYHCAFSPNPQCQWLVIAANTFGRTANHLLVYQMDSELGKLKEKKKVYMPVFKSKHEHFRYITISLDFSSDGKILAVGSPQGKVFLFSTETWKIISDVGQNEEYSCNYYGLFNPLGSSYELLVCTENGYLQKWTTKPLYKEDESVRSGKLELVDTMDNTEMQHHDDDGVGDINSKYQLNQGTSFQRKALVNRPQFSPNGEMLAISYSNGKVLIIDVNLFETLWTIQTNQIEELICPATLPICPISVYFSKSCEYLAVGYEGWSRIELVSVWLLPRSHFSLKHLCRTKVISNYPVHLIPDLPIPNAIKQYLLYQAKL